MKTLRHRLTYANVIATLALFLSVGGVGYAATQLPRNSVGTAQIKASSVTATKIKKGAITGSKVDLGSLGTVPSATRAATADSAASASSANDAAQLGGIPASGYQGRAMWALVDSRGAISQQSGGISLQAHPTSGSYFLSFPAAALGKAILVSPTQAEAGPSGVAAIATACGNVGGASLLCGYGTDTTGDVLVETSAFLGGEEESSFYIAVMP